MLLQKATFIDSSGNIWTNVFFFSSFPQVPLVFFSFLIHFPYEQTVEVSSMATDLLLAAAQIPLAMLGIASPLLAYLLPISCQCLPAHIMAVLVIGACPYEMY